MKDKWQKIISIVCVILLVVCVFRIGGLENEVADLKHQLLNTQSMLQSNISAISSKIRYELEQQSSLVSDSGWNTADLNLKDKTVVMECFVVPKSYNPDKTQASLICNETEYPMTLENGRYVTDINLSITEEITVSGVNFTEDGTISTEKLYWHINPQQDLIPSMLMYYSGSVSQNYDKVITKKYSGHIDIDFEHKGFSKELEKLDVYMLIDDKEVWHGTPQLEMMYDDSYITNYRAEIQQNFEMQRGSKVLMYAEAVDANGWIYRIVLEDATVGEKGNFIPNRDFSQYEADIYDADRNLIFKANS